MGIVGSKLTDVGGSSVHSQKDNVSSLKRMEGSKDGRIGLTSVFFLKTFSLGNIGEADIFTRQEKWDSRLIVV